MGLFQTAEKVGDHTKDVFYGLFAADRYRDRFLSGVRVFFHNVVYKFLSRFG